MGYAEWVGRGVAHLYFVSLNDNISILNHTRVLLWVVTGFKYFSGIRYTHHVASKPLGEYMHVLLTILVFI